MACYTVTDYDATIAVDAYVSRFRDACRFESCCRACGNYGRSWGCPPFDYDVLQRLSHYKSLLIVATKIVPDNRNMTFEAFNASIRPERVRLESRLLDMEQLHNGLAATYVGDCLHCPQGECTRLEGKPCRYPDRVRPSLEAYGFDMGKTVAELFGIELCWSSDGLLPPYIVLVSGLFHNSDLLHW